MRGILQTAKRGGRRTCHWKIDLMMVLPAGSQPIGKRSEEHTSELQSRFELVCRLLLEKKNENNSGNECTNARLLGDFPRAKPAHSSVGRVYTLTVLSDGSRLAALIGVSEVIILVAPRV